MSNWLAYNSKKVICLWWQCYDICMFIGIFSNRFFIYCIFSLRDTSCCLALLNICRLALTNMRTCWRIVWTREKKAIFIWYSWLQDLAFCNNSGKSHEWFSKNFYFIELNFWFPNFCDEFLPCIRVFLKFWRSSRKAQWHNKSKF